MVINSSHLYKLIVELISQNGTKSSFTEIADLLYLSDASANRFRAGYVSSQDKQAWWPNHTAWFCNALINCPMSRLCVQKNQLFPDVIKTKEQLWQNISIQLYKQMKETASPDLKRFYQNKLKQCTIGEKYEPLTFESHVFNQLMMFYKTSNLTISQLDVVLSKVLTNCQNTSEVLLLHTASEKFRYLITKCCANKGIDLEKENSKDLLAQLSNPDDLCNLINSFTNGTVYHMFKYPKLEFNDVLIYMNNPSFNLKLTNEYLAKTIGFCMSKENLLPYAVELCVIALKSYPDDEKLLGCAIQTALLSKKPNNASEYVKTADKLSKITDIFLLKSLINYYSTMLFICPNRKYGSSKKKLLQYVDMYISYQPYDEKPLFSVA